MGSRAIKPSGLRHVADHARCARRWARFALPNLQACPPPPFVGLHAGKCCVEVNGSYGSRTCRWPDMIEHTAARTGTQQGSGTQQAHTAGVTHTAGVRSCCVHRTGIGFAHGETPADQVCRRALPCHLAGRRTGGHLHPESGSVKRTGDVPR
jgi:hypothetical protein